MSRTTIDTCTRCGKEDCRVTVIDDVDRVCDECLEAFYFQCEVCNEYWEDCYVEQFWLKDGRVICEHCREDFDDDDIDFTE